jgi:hypothetical protein
MSVQRMLCTPQLNVLRTLVVSMRIRNHVLHVSEIVALCWFVSTDRRLKLNFILVKFLPPEI